MTIDYRHIKKLLFIIVVVTIILIFIRNKPGSIVGGYTKFGKTQYKQLSMPRKGEEIAIIQTEIGEIKIRLFPDIAPKAVENFIGLAKEGFYDEAAFNRVLDDIAIDITENISDPVGQSIFGEYFQTEISDEYYHFTGAVGLAKNSKEENGSNFYIVCNKGIEPGYLHFMSIIGEEGGYPPELIRTYKRLGGVPRFDQNFTIFGQVFYGLDTVFKIGAQSTILDSDTGHPIAFEPVVIKRIEIVPYENDI